MEIVSTVLYSACGVTLLGCAFALVRNGWVYRWQRTFIQEASAAANAEIDRGELGRWKRFYDAVPDYDEMMRRWWVWDARKFQRGAATMHSPISQAQSARVIAGPWGQSNNSGDAA